MLDLYIKIVSQLKLSNIQYIEHRHAPVRTSEEASIVRGSKLEEGAKALIFKADTSPIQIVLQGNKRVSKDKLREYLHVFKLKMASSDEVLNISSVEPGGVPPFGNLFPNPIPVYADENLLKLEYIEFNAGDQSISIRMKTVDWVKLVNPIILDIAE